MCIISLLHFFYTESSICLPQMKLAGSFLVLHSVKYAAMNIYCDIILIFHVINGKR